MTELIKIIQRLDEWKADRNAQAYGTPFENWMHTHHPTESVSTVPVAETSQYRLDSLSDAVHNQISQARAWRAVCEALDRVSPDWLRNGVPAMDSAVAAIEALGRIPAQTGIAPRSPMAQVADMACALRDLLAQHGMVLTVYQQPLKPLAMGNYETVVSVRLARNTKG